MATKTRKQDIPQLYAIYRLALLEKHTNQLYAMLTMLHPEEADQLGEMQEQWRDKVDELHQAFLRADCEYFDNFEEKWKR